MTRPIRRPRPIEDKVTGLMRVQVISRDYMAMQRAGVLVSQFTARRKDFPVCVAPVIDPTEFGKCWGRTTLDHVRDHARLGKRAPSDLDHLVSLCQGHTEDGRKAGYQWNTANRPALRSYLASVSA